MEACLIPFLMQLQPSPGTRQPPASHSAALQVCPCQVCIQPACPFTGIGQGMSAKHCQTSIGVLVLEKYDKHTSSSTVSPPSMIQLLLCPSTQVECYTTAVRRQLKMHMMTTQQARQEQQSCRKTCFWTLPETLTAVLGLV